MTGELTHTTSKERMVTDLMVLLPQLSITEREVAFSLRFQLYSAIFSITNEEQHKKCLCNQSTIPVTNVGHATAN